MFNANVGLVLALTLEELDQVFSVSTRKHASYQIKNAIWHFRVWVLRQKLQPLPDFYQGAERLAEVGDASFGPGVKGVKADTMS
jgi:hypothetical protein